MKNLFRLLLLGVLLQPLIGFAHAPSDSFLRVEKMADTRWQIDWEIAVRDLHGALDLDRDNSGELTQSEVLGQAEAIGAFALRDLRVSNDGKDCRLAVDDFSVRNRSPQSFVALQIIAQCATDAAATLHYGLFFDHDPTHRGLLNFVDGADTHTAVLSPAQREQRLDAKSSSVIGQFIEFIREGVWHIWIGLDHIFFLLTLLLPAVLISGRLAATSYKTVFVDTLKIVTAFTVAHSVTLSLAALEIIVLPSRFVESAIALSVVIAALGNLLPQASSSRWSLAFLFGLIHGFGFANVLQDLGLPSGQLALSLLGFNLGVELGQLAIVAGFLPIIFALRKSRFYYWGLLRGGSLAAAAVASLWLVERLFDSAPLDPIFSL